MEFKGRRKDCSSIQFSLGSSETTTGYGFDSSGHENGGSMLECEWCSHMSSLDEVSMANEEGLGLTKKMNVDMRNNEEGDGSKKGKKCFAGWISETTIGCGNVSGFDSSGHENFYSPIRFLDEVSMANEEGLGLTKKMNVDMGNNGEGDGSKKGKKSLAGWISETTTGYGNVSGFDSSEHENFYSPIRFLDEVSMANEEGLRLTKKMNVDMGNNGEGDGSKKGKKCFAGLSRRQWTDEEDRKLIAPVKQCGERKWMPIAEKLASPGRNLKRGRWSEEEDKILIETYEKFGNKWAKIAKFIPGRTEIAIKTHWNSAKRRQRRKNKPRSYVLEDYFQSKHESNPSPPDLPSPTSFQSTISTFFFPSSRSPRR